jgi:hypothetical protein
MRVIKRGALGGVDRSLHINSDVAGRYSDYGGHSKVGIASFFYLIDIIIFTLDLLAYYGRMHCELNELLWGVHQKSFSRKCDFSFLDKSSLLATITGAPEREFYPLPHPTLFGGEKSGRY